MIFQRRLNRDFLAALNALYRSGDEGKWWKQILDDDEIFLAIREDAIHAYYRGCCLANISHSGSKLRVTTHFKYLIKPRLKREYIESFGGKPVLDSWQPDLRSVFSDMTDLEAIKAAAKPYAGGEKASVAQIINNHTGIIDVEVALTDASPKATNGAQIEEADAAVDVDETGARPSANRLDIATARQREDAVEISFYEAKLFTNPELRKTGAKPRVIEQIERYEALLSRYEAQIVASYRASADNIMDIEGIDSKRKQTAKIVADASNLLINTRPFLIITEFDADQKKGSVWAAHLEKIRDLLGKERVLLRGKASGINLHR